MENGLNVAQQKPRVCRINLGEIHVVMEHLNSGKPIPELYSGKQTILNPLAGEIRLMLKAGHEMKKLGLPVTRENLEAAYQLNWKNEYIEYITVPVHEIGKITLPQSMPDVQEKLPFETNDLGVKFENGQIVVSSINVSLVFEKEHKNVLRDIENLDCSREFTALNFELSKYKDSTGRSLPCYNMTRDGFAFLCMGYTGKKAATFKEAYIKQFNEMEKALINPDQSIAVSSQNDIYTPEKAAELVGLPGYRVLYKLLVRFGLIYRHSQSKGYFPTIEALERGYVVICRAPKLNKVTEPYNYTRPALTSEGLKYVRDRMKIRAISA